MTTRFKMDYIKKIYQRYHKSSRQAKRQILDEFCKVCDYNRKYAIRVLNAPLKSKPKSRPRRNSTYSEKTINIVESIWKYSGYLWSYRLKSVLSSWMPWAKLHFDITPEIEKQLLSISPATIDRRLKDKKRRLKKSIYRSTRPGTLLKRSIPIKTDNWDVNKPGFLEIDLVSHGGSSAEGDFIYSLNTTDIHTGWTETRAIMGRGQTSALGAIEDIKNSLPFTLKAIDPDNDGAFINHHLLKFCQKNKIQFTRSRPYKKDDNAHIEQKNWTHVRKLLGYLRYDSQEALDAINDLYINELRYFMNFFQPSVKLIKKIRIGSKLKKVHDAPKTPLARLNCKTSLSIDGSINKSTLAKLNTLMTKLDPFSLSQSIDKKLDHLFSLANEHKKLRRRPYYSDALISKVVSDSSFGYIL